MSTLVIYPDASSGGTTCDGYAARNGVNETFSIIRGGTGTSGTALGGQILSSLSASNTTNQFESLYRFIATFDTSSLTSLATISNAVISLYGHSYTSNGLGNTNLDIVSSTPTSNNNIVLSDYSQLGTTVFSTIAYTSFNNSNYNNFTLNSNGISNISKTGISRFGGRLAWDTSNSFSGTWGPTKTTAYWVYASDETGTTKDPKLTITYTLNLKNINGLSSIKTKNSLLKDSIKTFNGL